MEALAKKFRLSEFVKDGYLAAALREELKDLKAKELDLAEQAITEIATSGITGTYDELVSEYRRAIRRALEPERKLVKHPLIDRKIVKNAQLAAVLDRELKDVTQAELDRANGAVKALIEEVKGIATTNAQGGEAQPGEERFVEHEPSDICRINKRHSTLGACGYFKDPAAWADVFRAVVRKAISG